MNATDHMRIVTTRRRRWCRALSALLPILILALASSAAPAHAQALYEAGYPTIVNHTPNEYGGLPQNWAITQDERGVMYVGNNSGLLEYDGQTWRLHTVPNRTPVRSLAADGEGRIYAGAIGELGYFAPDARGQLTYHSLIEHLPDDRRDFADVWQTDYLNGKVYFDISTALLIWNPEVGEFTVVESATTFHVGAVAGDRLYMRERGTGLHVMDADDTLRLLPGGEQFADELIYSILPFPGEPGTLLITTRTQGLFTFDGSAFTPFTTAADAFLRENPVYLPGTILSDDTILLGTLTGGAVIIDRDGRVVARYDQQAGITNNAILYTFQDRSGLVWLATDSGLSVVDSRSPLRFFDQRNQFATNALDLTRYNGDLIVSGTTGVYRLAAGRSTFQKLENFDSQAFELLPVGDDLFAATIEGVFTVEENRLVPVRRSVAGDYRANILMPSRVDPDHIFVGTETGLASLRRTATGWSDEGLIAELPGQKTSVVEMGEGEFWMGTWGTGLSRIQQAADGGAASVRQYGAAEGLQPGASYVFETGGILYANSPDSLYVYDEGRDAFHSDPSDALTAAFYRLTDQKRIKGLAQTREGDLWIWTEDTMARGVLQERGEIVWETDAYRRAVAMGVEGNGYTDEEGITWFNTLSTGFVALDTRAEQTDRLAFPALIRRVEAGADSTLFFGNADQPPETRLAYADNTVRFTYAGAGYEAKGGHQFSTRLEGFDAGWSAWSELPVREYVNLPPNEYTFRVMARNAAGVESTPAAYTFTILPPWWRTWWAYLLYALAVAGVLLGFISWRTRHLQARQRELEATVAERTTELEQRKTEIQQRANELAVINSVQEGLVRELDIQAIYNLVGDRLRELFDAQVLFIATFDHEAGVETFHYHVEEGKRTLPASRPMDRLRQQLVETQAPIHIEEDFAEALVQMGYDRPEPLPGTKMPKSVLLVPLVVADNVLGYVSLQNVDREHAFRASDVRLLTTLTNSLSVALENARLFAETRQQATELDTVNRVSRALVGQLEFDALVHLVGEQMRHIFDADIVYVALHDRETDMLRFPYEHGDETPPRRFADGLTEKIITSREPLLINRDIDDVREQLEASKKGRVAASYLGVPILVGDDAIGVISVQSTTRENRFTDASVRLLSTLAANVGVALKNAEAYRTLEKTLAELKTTQQQLVQQEKLASLGELTAGIAHEIKNPLNFITNFSALTSELAGEISTAAAANDLGEVRFLVEDLQTNAQMIEKHGKRADSIVRSMMEHARTGSGTREAVGLNALIDEYVDLAYHGKRATRPAFNAEIVRDYGPDVGQVEVVPQEFGRVVLNLVGNAFDALMEHAGAQNGHAATAARGAPRLQVATRRTGGAVEVRVADNGPGIPEATRQKIFEPFFTTKETGKGTGLGLSMSYDIVTQGHGGTLDVESTPGEGSTFIVRLPGASVSPTT